jgi:endogenous inhibitor of DNA gyrase (YacG/DUF329 family)
MDFKCPTCGKVIPSASSLPEGKRQINATFFPFCSERCRLVDLNAWMDGDYRIPTKDQLPEDNPSE